MKISMRSWRWTLPALAALAWTTNGALAQQPLSAIELAQPIAAEPAAPTAEEADTDSSAPTESEGETAKPDETADEASEEKAPTPAMEAETEEPATLPMNDAVVELIKERYPGGAVKVEREMTQEADGSYVLHGAWRQFDEQGRLIVDGRNEHNQKVGLWRKFYRGNEAPLLATAPTRILPPPSFRRRIFTRGRSTASG